MSLSQKLSKQLSEFKISQPLSTITNNLRKVKTGATIIHYYQKLIFSLIWMQYKPKRNKTLHGFCFFIAHHDRLRTYDRRTDADML